MKKSPASAWCLDGSWFLLAGLNVLGSVGGFCTGGYWAARSIRSGPRFLLFIGSGYLFLNSVYFFVARGQGIGWLLPVALLGGALNAAWSIGANQFFLSVAPRAERGYFISAYNLTNGWLMAGGPLIGGLLADRLPILNVRLPGGGVCCYFHLLLAAALIGGAMALLLIVRVPTTCMTVGLEGGRRAEGVFWARLRLPRLSRVSSFAE